MVPDGPLSCRKMYNLDGGLLGKYRKMPKGTWPNATDCWYEVLLVKELFHKQYLWVPSLCLCFMVITIHFSVSKIGLGSVGNDCFIVFSRL